MAYSVSTGAYAHAIENTLTERRWDVVVVDHLQMGWALRRIQNGAIVYVSQNHEESVRRQVACRIRRSWIEGVALRLDSAKVTRLERLLVSVCDLLTATTQEDAERFARRRPGLRRLVLPPGYDGGVVEQRRISTDVPRRAVIVGNLFWHVKQHNLQAFLDAADPLFYSANAELLVVGPAPDDFVRRVLRTTRATRFAGRVDTLTETLANVRLGIVSEPLGGGFKLKALDYIFHRVPMAVLDGSVAGLPLTAGTEYLSSATQRGLAEVALAAMDDLDFLNRLQERAYSAAASRFNWATRGEALRDSMASLT